MTTPAISMSHRFFMDTFLLCYIRVSCFHVRLERIPAMMDLSAQGADSFPVNLLKTWIVFSCRGNPGGSTANMIDYRCAGWQPVAMAPSMTGQHVYPAHAKLAPGHRVMWMIADDKGIAQCHAVLCDGQLPKRRMGPTECEPEFTIPATWA